METRCSRPKQRTIVITPLYWGKPVQITVDGCTNRNVRHNAGGKYKLCASCASNMQMGGRAVMERLMSQYLPPVVTGGCQSSLAHVI